DLLGSRFRDPRLHGRIERSELQGELAAQRCLRCLYTSLLNALLDTLLDAFCEALCAALFQELFGDGHDGALCFGDVFEKSGTKLPEAEISEHVPDVAD